MLMRGHWVPSGAHRPSDIWSEGVLGDSGDGTQALGVIGNGTILPLSVFICLFSGAHVA